MNREAGICSCGKYRYWLTRDWADPGERQRLPWVMLNPSTADANIDDPTIRRCMKFAEREGYTGIIVYNLFALRSTDPTKLLQVEDPVGPLNLQYLSLVGDSTALAIAAWGALSPKLKAQARVQVGILAKRPAPLRALGLTKDGSPRHPLYVRGDAKLVEFKG